MQRSAIIDAISEMTPDERRQLQAEIAQLKGGNREPLSKRAEMVAEAIYDITRERIPVTGLRKLKIDAQTAALFEWYGGQISELRDVQVRGLVLLSIKAIRNYLISRKQRVDTVSLLAGISDIGRAFEQAYPGYWSAKILWRLVRQAEAA
jgi:hypothetical protein